MTDNKDNQNEKLESAPAMEYPCDFVIKMMGKNNDAFKTKATEIILNQFPEQKDTITFKEVPSKDNNYVAISAKVIAENQAQMDKCYQALTDEPLVLIAL